MKRTDDVFFFTLIDFLLQVFFFGLFLFVAAQALRQSEDDARKVDSTKIDDALKAAGVSSLTELTDLLSKLVPLDRLTGTAEFVAKNGGEAKVATAIQAMNAIGGPDKLAGLKAENEALNARIAKLEGWGKVSCLPNVMTDGRPQPRTVATAIVSDDAITLVEPTNELQSLLRTHGLDYEHVRRLSLSEFRSTFAVIVNKQPDCRYFMAVKRETRFFEPMGALWSAFRTL
ncbi:MAG: hypothetical protein CFE46_00785 [Burkholderiales bacterium PBB6]|nr:MAG: hypothetical protein CFE46_00785 [Burkholderiales bacterium PBB6]